MTCSCSCCVSEKKAFEQKLLKAYGEPSFNDDTNNSDNSHEFFDIVLTDDEIQKMKTVRKQVEQRIFA